MADEETTNQTSASASEEATADKEETTEESTEEQTQDAAEESTDEQSSSDDSTANDESSSDDSASADESSDEGEEVEVPEKFQSIVSEIEGMSVLDLNELVKVLEKKFGVTAAAAAAPAAGGGDAGGGEEEKHAFTVELTDVGDQKIGVIKVVKNVLGLGLKEAKDMAENLPATLKEDMPKEEAEDLKSQVEEAGGSVELK